MLRLLTFGGLTLESPDGAPVPRLRAQRLAMLAVLANAGDRGISRESAASLFWPETDDERARHSLRQALYALRLELGADLVGSGAVLTLDRSAISSDVGDFRSALASGDRVRAAQLARGVFLQGFYLPGAAAFERWVEEERAALIAETTRVTLALAREAEQSGDQEGAADWWRRLTRLDPLSGRFALGYLKALAASGDRAGALAFARTHEGIVRRELEADPDPEIRRLEAELRAMPSPKVPHSVAPVTPPAAVAAGTAAGTAAGAAAGAARGAAEGAEPGPGAPVAASPATGPAGVAPSDEGGPARARWRPMVPGLWIGALVLAVGLTMGVWYRVARASAGAEVPVFAVGLIREDGVPDTLRIGGVVTDMLATNLARVAGLRVLANTRLFELMLPGQDTMVTGYSDAAKRAGATEILQGQLLAGPEWGLAMEIQRVDLATGVVRGGYRVTARDRYSLVDSMTTVIARDLRLESSGGSVADATTDSPIAYRFYEEGLRAYYQYDYPAARRLMRAALAEDSTFAMAAYYAALTSVEGSAEELANRARALRLAAHAPERERLTITAAMLVAIQDPDDVAAAESLAVKYPDDPRAFEMIARSRFNRGEWSAAVTASERAIALDSASEPVERQNCRICAGLDLLTEVYLWWDSLPAAERTARRLQRLRPRSHLSWHHQVRIAAARANVAALRANFRSLHEVAPFETPAVYRARYFTLAEEYDSATAELRALLDSPRESEIQEARWYMAIVRRNQGQLAETQRLAAGTPPRNYLVEALVALEQRNPRRALELLRGPAESNPPAWPRGVHARAVTWNKTLYGMALAAAGDTARLHFLADTVEYWGQRSIYGRDRKLHHYLRGMLLVAERRDGAAVDEFRRAINSPTHGFTRINLELGRALLRLRRPAEAVPVLRSALHGDIDGSNLYVSRTDLHEALGRAFAQLGDRDSATVHYRAVVRAWERADPEYRARREQAADWLVRFSPLTR